MSTFVDIVEDFGFEVFGTLDKRQDGLIGSEYPCWYLTHHIEEEERLIHNEEIQLKRGGVHESQRFEVERRVGEERAKLEAIKEAKPKLSDIQLDKVGEVHRELGGDIASAMPGRETLKSGINFDPHAELIVLSDQVVPVTKIVQRFIILCNGRVKDGMVSRTDAEKAWKIAGRLLEYGKGTNSELLRKAK